MVTTAADSDESDFDDLGDPDFTMEVVPRQEEDPGIILVSI